MGIFLKRMPEYQGIAPDIWVQGKDVLKYVKELLK